RPTKRSLFRELAPGKKILQPSSRSRGRARQHASRVRSPERAAQFLCFSRLGRLKRMSKKMRVVQVPRAGGPFELVERDIPEPGRGWVRVKVEACGICHSDSLVKEGLWPGIQYPRVPGHEVIGVVDDVGEGVKPFNALRNSGARGGDVVAVLGIGGLGHLGVQFAARMGFNTVAIARGKDKEAFAKKLGAHHYIDSQASDPAAELNKLGGAKVVIATVTNAEAMAAVLGGVAPNGVLMVIGAAGPLSVDPILLIMGQRSVKGWYSGTSIDSQDTLEFSASAA